MRELDVLQAALQQFYEDRHAAAGDSSAAGAARGRRRNARGVALVARRTPRPVDRPQARREARACSSSRRATPKWRISSATTRTPPRITTRWKRCAACSAAGGAAPHRMLRHLDDSRQRHGRLDGGVRGRPDAEGRVSEVPDSRCRRVGSPEARKAGRPKARKSGRSEARKAGGSVQPGGRAGPKSIVG